MPSRLYLLLSATINPKGILFTRRSDPEKRLKDYQLAIAKWSTNTLFDSIILCENSNHDLSVLRRSSGDAVRFLSFSGNDYPRHLGKGYGELNILKHFLELSDLSEGDRIVKVTGRYRIGNADKLIRFVRHRQECEIICNVIPDGTYAYSGIFATSPRFLREYLLPLQDCVNDSAGFWLEHALANAVENARRDGVRWAPFPQAPQIHGISGTLDQRLDPSPIHKLYSRAINRLRRLSART